jgi:hypothetical protein
MHPLEQMRYLARGWEAGPGLPAQELAGALADVASENPASLLQACRRLIEHHPAAGVAWWLSARALSAPDPVEAIDEAARELAADPTVRLLAEALPSRARVCAPQAGPVVVAALRRRKDAVIVRSPEHRTGGAAFLLVEAWAAGPEGVLAGKGLVAAVKAARRQGWPVWAVAARGTLLPEALWRALLARSPMEVELLASSLLSCVAGDQGLESSAEALGRPTCSAVAELLGWRT